MSLDRLKAVWRKAVVLVGGGAALAAALWVAMGEQTPPMTCAEWTSYAERLSEPQARHTFYAARKQGVSLPPELGTCAAGVCSIGPPDGCPDALAITYELAAGPFKTFASVQWQVLRIEAHPFVAGQLKAFADANPTAVKWWASLGQVVDACLAYTTAANCRDMLAPLHGCWLLPTGDLCRYGQLTRITGPGQPGDGACTPGAGSKPYICTTARGAGGGEADAVRVWAEEELAQ